jgi:nucleoside phosphorylase/CheY-like chemotaxis protein
MIRVLIVDDDTEKVRRVVECLQHAGVNPGHIDECRDAHKAKLLLQESSYDLLILDVVLPNRIDQEPVADGGVKLLMEVSQRERYRAPDHVVGLTAYPDAYKLAKEPFLLKSWTVIQYDPQSDEWSKHLETKAEQIIWARHAVLDKGQEYASDLAIVCALDDPELSSIKTLPWHWEKWRLAADPTIYLKGSYEVSGRLYTVHAAASARMGMTAAAIVATKMVIAFRPRYIANVGIAAAIQGRANYGDVVSADITWDYGSGKYAIVDGEPRFLASPNQYQLAADLRSRVIEFADNEGLLSEITKGWRGDRPETRLRVLLGPVASGATVVADESKAQEIAAQHRSLLGVEMETYAIFAAAEECPAPRPLAFSLKGVSDFADSRKDDRFQRYAAYTSAECLRHFAERHLK